MHDPVKWRATLFLHPISLAVNLKFKDLLRFIIHELYNGTGNNNCDDCANPEFSTEQNAHYNHNGVQHHADCFHLPAVLFRQSEGNCLIGAAPQRCRSVQPCSNGKQNHAG